ncbi:hypothetical protein B296_00051663 [Ensete ventricosum]|uniref:Uncharacterized protein n=1 Tax=Ensete ventricosum TaxID=4639 RepID=A0A426Y5I5_ENSVE|nr:hypothetical protein B296_00051663 [Ensete ventricosum]
MHRFSPFAATTSRERPSVYWRICCMQRWRPMPQAIDVFACRATSHGHLARRWRTRWCHARKRPPLRVSTTTTSDRPYMHLGRQPLPQ